MKVMQKNGAREENKPPSWRHVDRLYPSCLIFQQEGACESFHQCKLQQPGVIHGEEPRTPFAMVRVGNKNPRSLEKLADLFRWVRNHNCYLADISTINGPETFTPVMKYR
jgi:hypothetical protein